MRGFFFIRSGINSLEQNPFLCSLICKSLIFIMKSKLQENKMIKPMVIRNLSIIILFLFIQFALCQSNSSPNTVEDYIELCKTNLDSNNSLEAVKFGEKAVKLEVTNANAHYWLGQAYGSMAQEAPIYKKFFYAKKCKREWEKAIHFNKKHIEARKMLISYHLQAPSIVGGDKGIAMDLANEVNKLDVLQGYLVFGQIFISQKKYNEAEQEYQKAIEIDPSETDSYYYLNFLYQKQEKYSKAKEILLEMLNIKPGEFEVYYQLGKTVLLSNENLSEGITYFEKYLEQEENNRNLAFAHWRIGEIYEKLNNKVSAKNEYTIALKLDAANKEAKKALKKLDK